jgi:hypothetical protein
MLGVRRAIVIWRYRRGVLREVSPTIKNAVGGRTGAGALRLAAPARR